MNSIVIVDAYASGSVLGKKYKNLGFQTIHLKSSDKITPKFLSTFTSEYFDIQIEAGDNFSDTVLQISEFNPQHVIAGTETGVSLSEKLAHHCGLTSNKIELLEARRDKIVMAQCAAAQGLRVPNSETIQNILDLEPALNSLACWPVVIKPSASAGADNVVIAKNKAELLEAANRILKHTNKLGLLNEKAILQEYISGTEYSVNAVTHGGTNKFTHIWKYFKKEVMDGKYVYDWEHIVDPDSDVAKKIVRYMNQLLPAVGIVKGPSHSEVKVDQHGVCLIETSARLDGTLSEQSDLLSVGHTQVDLAIEAEVNSFGFDSKYPNIYDQKLHAANVYLISEQSGKIVSESILSKIKSRCPSFLGGRIHIKDGDEIERTCDLFNTPGIVFLVSDSFEQIKKDYQMIRYLEAQGELYSFYGEGRGDAAPDTTEYECHNIS